MLVIREMTAAIVVVLAGVAGGCGADTTLPATEPEECSICSGAFAEAASAVRQRASQLRDDYWDPCLAIAAAWTKGRGTVSIERGAFLRVTEDLIRLVQLAKPHLRLGISRIAVRMVLGGPLAEGRLDLGGRRLVVQSEQLVGVTHGASPIAFSLRACSEPDRDRCPAVGGATGTSGRRCRVVGPRDEDDYSMCPEDASGVVWQPTEQSACPD